MTPFGSKLVEIPANKLRFWGYRNRLGRAVPFVDWRAGVWFLKRTVKTQPRHGPRSDTGRPPGSEPSPRFCAKTRYLMPSLHTHVYLLTSECDLARAGCLALA
ncbi:hypothetical protein ZHAS_00003123 [Anopheles sinensis]|uniref:Uncharacterized protein n=1 Tax=Anopheles sinensis TaxID=74873 RepID=A0A084VDP5_ANOSI|nr:hypothetical protein ZHAS_00003123 [Anopheles sinensis]